MLTQLQLESVEELPEKVGSGPCLVLCFRSFRGISELAGSFFRAAGDRGPGHFCEKENLGPWCKSLKALCIALLLAKLKGGRRNWPTNRVPIGTTIMRDSWLWCLGQALEKESGWRDSILAGKSTARSLLEVLGGRTAKQRTAPRVASGELATPARAYYRTNIVPLEGLAFLSTAYPSLNTKRSEYGVAVAAELLKQIGAQVPGWRDQLELTELGIGSEWVRVFPTESAGSSGGVKLLRLSGWLLVMIPVESEDKVEDAVELWEDFLGKSHVMQVPDQLERAQGKNKRRAANSPSQRPKAKREKKR